MQKSCGTDLEFMDFSSRSQKTLLLFGFDSKFMFGYREGAISKFLKKLRMNLSILFYRCNRNIYIAPSSIAMYKTRK